jgi:ABC-type sugar transport system ATPase subunit
MPQRRHTFEAVGVSKAFSGVTVVDEVDFGLRSGEVHALLGENGSGKSTLIRVLGGVHRPTGGHVAIEGRPVALTSPAQAQRAGLGIVHQDLNLFPDLDIATNIAIAAGAPVHGVTRLVDRVRLRSRARDVLDRLGLDVDPRLELRELGLAEWKLVEIARALLTDVDFLILDEPTALLDRRDSRTVLATVARLRDEGLGVALVTHRLDEALEIADRFTVLRDGRRVAVLERGEVEAADLVRHIVGAEASSARRAIARYDGPGEPMLALRDVALRRDGRPFALEVRRGEILGLTGLVGAGALELARALGGRSPLRGGVRVGDREVVIRSPRDAIRAGIGYVPEDRKEAGIVDGLSVETNLCLASLPAVSPNGVLRRASVRQVAQRFARELGVRAPSLSAPIETLSGGNQQKVQIGKWLASGQKLLVVESPTHGVDVGAKADIHRLLQEFAAAGGAVVVASTDIPDVLAVADRIAVFQDGTLARVVAGARSSHRELLLSGAHDAKLDEIEELIEV